jgi:hypothetical protein
MILMFATFYILLNFSTKLNISFFSPLIIKYFGTIIFYLENMILVYLLGWCTYLTVEIQVEFQNHRWKKIQMIIFMIHDESLVKRTTIYIVNAQSNCIGIMIKGWKLRHQKIWVGWCFHFLFWPLHLKNILWNFVVFPQN